MGKPKRWDSMTPEEQEAWREKRCELARKWRAKNPEKSHESERKWRAKNPEKQRELARKWRAKNPEKYRELERKWRAKNPEKSRETSRKSKAKKALEDASADALRMIAAGSELLKSLQKLTRETNEQ